MVVLQCSQLFIALMCLKKKKTGAYLRKNLPPSIYKTFSIDTVVLLKCFMERYLLIILGTLSAILKGMLKCSMERYLFIIIVRNIFSSF